jgi:hypothetical protein
VETVAPRLLNQCTIISRSKLVASFVFYTTCQCSSFHPSAFMLMNHVAKPWLDENPSDFISTGEMASVRKLSLYMNEVEPEGRRPEKSELIPQHVGFHKSLNTWQ